MSLTKIILGWKKLCVLGFLLFSFQLRAQIVLEFCPVTKVQASKQWNSTMNIRNNTGVVLDLANNDFQMEWPSLEALQWPFSDGVKSGIDWTFKINLDYPGTLAVGATATKNVNGNLYSGVLQFPTSGTYTQNGVTYTVEIEHCNQTNPYELYDASFDFDRNCFLYSPTSGLCLGEGASEIWGGEGIYDIMVPVNRPSWAIGVMVAHRLFSNLVGDETMLSPNFWTATSLNESRMTCDAGIVPNRQNHCYINSNVTACQNTGVGTMGGTNVDNCFQVLSLGYTQISDNQPDLFAQTNAYGTATYSTIVGADQWETGAIAVAYYHYQDIQYWNSIFCWNAHEFSADSQDPYAVEKVFYHAYHDGPNAGISLLNDIDANYAAAVAATNMNTVINSSGTWSSTTTGSQKVANFTSLLDGNGVLYPTQKSDETVEYYGCYQADIAWADVLYYLDKIKILYPHVMDAGVQAEIQAVYNGLNGGADVPFSNFGPVIDEIVIQLGGHDPSSYIATQFGASKVCGENPLGVSLRTNDTLCPGESGHLQVWLAGDPNFSVDIQYPDGSIHSFTGIDASPYYIEIDQPGHYEVIAFSDADETGNPNCNFAAITVESRNDAIVGWDKSNVDAIQQCATGDLMINKLGDDPVTVSYTLDGIAQTDINLGAGDLSQVIQSNVVGGQYIITTMTPNACGTPINDTITFCASMICTPPAYEILTPDTAICDGETANIRFSFTGTAPFNLYYTSSTDGAQSVTGINSTTYSLPLTTAQLITVDSVVDQSCTNDTAKTVSLTVNSIPSVNLGADITVCGTPNLMMDAGNPGATYAWSTSATTQTINVTADGSYDVAVTMNGCTGRDTVVVTENPDLVVDLGADASICAGSTLTLDAGNPGATYDWSTTATSQTIDITTGGTYSVTVTANGCSGQDEIVITESSALVVDLGADTTLCPGVTLTLDAGNPGATYDWSTTETSQTIDVNGDGTYSVAVTANGCSGQDEIVITIGTDISVNLGNDTSLCPGETLILDAGHAGAIYTWGDGSTGQTLSVDTAGTYEVMVLIDNCIGQDEITIGLHDAVTVDLGNDTALCDGNTITLDAGNPGASYAWSTLDNSQTLLVNSSDTYQVTVTDGNGCEGTDEVMVTISPRPVVDLGADVTICEGAPLVLDAANAGFSYLWSTLETDQTVTVTTAGTYSVTVSGGGVDCFDRDTIVVSSLAAPIVYLGEDTTICQGASLTLDAGNPGDDYDWSTGETTQSISVTTANDYFVTVTNSADCETTDTISVEISNGPVVDLGDDETICAGATLVVDAQNTGLTFNWNTGATSQTVAANDSGWYKVTVTDLFGCPQDDSVYVTVQALPVVDFGGDTSICPGESVLLDAGNAGASFAWNTGGSGQLFTAEDAGIYEVTVTDAFGCEGSDAILLSYHAIVPASITAPSDICSGEALVSFTTAPTGGVISGNFLVGEQFDPNALGVVVDLENWYIYEVTDANGCSSSDSTSITVRDTPAPELNVADSTVCAYDLLTLTVNVGTGFSITWWDAELGDQLESGANYNVNSSGSYVALASSAWCSAYSDTATIRVVDPSVVATQSPEGNISEGDPVTLSVESESPELSYSWENLVDGTVFNAATWGFIPLLPATYRVTAQQEHCSAEDELFVNVVLELSIPNTFTPNDDGINDEWVIQGIHGYPNASIIIYNRWGSEVHLATGDLQNWDGKIGGKKLPVGTYYYVLHLNDDDGRVISGDLSLVK